MLKDKNFLNFIFKLICLIVSIVLFLFIFRTCSETYQTPDVTANQIKIDSLLQAVWIKSTAIHDLNYENERKIHAIDSLETLIEDVRSSKVRIKTKYDSVYIFIEHSGNHELDSIIRSNW